MLRHLPWVLLVAGCASAPPPQPQVVERVVVLQAPGAAPVSVEHQGYGAEPRRHHGKSRRYDRHPGKPRRDDPKVGHGKPPKRHHVAAPERPPNDSNPKWTRRQTWAKQHANGHAGEPRDEKRDSQWTREQTLPKKHASRCDEKPTEDARKRCRMQAARR